MALDAIQIRFLRGLAHDLNPVVMVGQKGMSDGVRMELDDALSRHELVKIRVIADDRDERDALIKALSRDTKSELIQKVGHTATFFRRAATPQLQLPGDKPTKREGGFERPSGDGQRAFRARRDNVGGGYGERPKRKADAADTRRPFAEAAAPKRSYTKRPPGRDDAASASPRRERTFGGRADGPTHSTARPFGERPPRGVSTRAAPPARDFEDRPARASAGGAAKRPSGDRSARPAARDFGNRPARPARDFGDRPARAGAGGAAKRPYGDRPARPAARDFGDRPARPARDFGDRPARAGADGAAKRPYGDRPARPARDAGDRPARPARDFGDRPARPARDFGDRPARAGAGGAAKRPYGDRPARPARDVGDRPARPARVVGERPARTFADRPARSAAPGADRPKRDYSDRPARPARDFGDRPARPAGAKPAYKSAKPGGFKPSARPSGGAKPSGKGGASPYKPLSTRGPKRDKD